MLEAIKQHQGPLSEQVADEISKYIINHHLGTGDRLPNEQVLASTLNVGRSTIREAIKTLISRNIVGIRRGCGTFVADMPGVVTDPFGFDFIRNKEKLIFDLLELRLILEPTIAALAAKRADRQDILAMEMIASDLEDLMKKDKQYAHKDVELHVQIAKSTKNGVMTTVIPILNQSVWLFREVTKTALISENMSAHRTIIEAIKKGDSEGAASAMRQHLLCNKEYIDKQFAAIER